MRPEPRPAWTFPYRGKDAPAQTRVRELAGRIALVLLFATLVLVEVWPLERVGAVLLSAAVLYALVHAVARLLDRRALAARQERVRQHHERTRREARATSGSGPRVRRR